MHIYKITNLVNNKIYVGQTQQEVSVRWTQHCCFKASPKMLITKAIKKYGKNNFKIETLATVDNLDLLNELEEFIIQELNAMNSNIGYNRRSGGKNYVMQEETKEKLRQANLGKKASEETKEKLREAAKHKRKRTPDECEAIRQRMLGTKHSETRCKNMSLTRINFKPSEEHKKANSEKLKGKPKSEETKAKMKAYHARKRLEKEENV